MRSGPWQDLTTLDFAGLDPEDTIALLPVAAIEQHGPHLPLATDALICEGIISAALQRLADRPTVLVLPSMWVGSSLEHTGFAGTLSIDAQTLMATWNAVGASVARSGVRKLVILNCHGGQTALVDLVALHLRAEQRLFVVRANYFAFGAPPDLFECDELAHGIHGGAAETSLMLHLRPDLVRQDAIRCFDGLPRDMAAQNRLLGAEKPVGFGWMSEDLHPEGVTGDATKADPEHGRVYLDHLADSLVTLLSEVAATPLSILDRSPENG
jgi:creatinine amidohydrolase